jgi:hypothetical protein
VNVLTINLVFSTFVFWIAARLYVLPRLHEPRTLLLPILLLHGFRHLGLMFLSPGATYPGLAPEFAVPAAYGDLLAAVLAKPLVWVFNLEGSIDLAAAITLATLYDAEPSMGAAYWIPSFWVPARLVTHYITFVLLAKPWPHASGREVVRDSRGAAALNTTKGGV